jgi:hypothetical protein
MKKIYWLLSGLLLAAIFLFIFFSDKFQAHRFVQSLSSSSFNERFIASDLAGYDSGTANDFKSALLYDGHYAYGSNMGYFGRHLSDIQVAELAFAAGSRTVRLSLPDRLLSGFGQEARLHAFQVYRDRLQMQEMTVFVGEPNDSIRYRNKGPFHLWDTLFDGCNKKARLFKGLYEPIWIDKKKRIVNPSNTYAAYLFKAVSTYGSYVKFWEVMNEPDFTHASAGWENETSSNSWWNVNPQPCDLSNLNAPVYYYVRMLRISWEVIKTLCPDSYVCTGGIGYSSFLDVLLRNTDNPVDGSINPNYPLKGGAYFDVVSYHDYPHYQAVTGSSTSGSRVYQRHSDAMVDIHLRCKDKLSNVLLRFGYDGRRYPLKKFIVTEVDLAREPVNQIWGHDVAASNFIIKCHVLSQVAGILQTYKYGLGDGADKNAVFNKMGLYEDLSNPQVLQTGLRKTNQWFAVRTTSDLLYGKIFDAEQTRKLQLPKHVRGAAFLGADHRYTYVLWVATTQDRSEEATSVYTFPIPFKGFRKEWDFSKAGALVPVEGARVQLKGSPSFFVEDTTFRGKPSL